MHKLCCIRIGQGTTQSSFPSSKNVTAYLAKKIIKNKKYSQKIDFLNLRKRNFILHYTTDYWKFFSHLKFAGFICLHPPSVHCGRLSDIYRVPDTDRFNDSPDIRPGKHLRVSGRSGKNCCCHHFRCPGHQHAGYVCQQGGGH